LLLPPPGLLQRFVFDDPDDDELAIAPAEPTTMNIATANTINKPLRIRTSRVDSRLRRVEPKTGA
jgi:hypothetical protein